MEDPSPIRELLRYQGEFMAYLMAILHDFDAAEEVFQNAAVVIVEGARSGEEIRNFRAWAKEIVRRQALYRLRKQAQTAKLFRPLTPELFEAVSEAFVEEDEEGGREVQALRGCLDKLPPRQRDMLVRRYERRESFEQIGQVVGSSPAAVQRALSRIRLALHDCVRATLNTEGRQAGQPSRERP
jgi:RNA polymerase sigma-70 factor (ECF subfamily)